LFAVHLKHIAEDLAHNLYLRQLHLLIKLWPKKNLRKDCVQPVMNQDGTGVTALIPPSSIFLWDYSTEEMTGGGDANLDTLRRLGQRPVTA
jgi:hypothetical protein